MLGSCKQQALSCKWHDPCCWLLEVPLTLKSSSFDEGERGDRILREDFLEETPAPPMADWLRRSPKWYIFLQCEWVGPGYHSVLDAAGQAASSQTLEPLPLSQQHLMTAVRSRALSSLITEDAALIIMHSGAFVSAHPSCEESPRPCWRAGSARH